jgi:hypothetical protein
VKPHRFDLVALLLGFAFAICGVIVLVHELSDRRINGGLIAAVGFVALGIVALVATLTQRAHRSAVEAEHPDS